MFLLSKLRAKTRNICKITPQAKQFLLSKLRAKTLLKSVADEQNIVFAFKHIYGRHFKQVLPSG